MTFIAFFTNISAEQLLLCLSIY